MAQWPAELPEDSIPREELLPIYAAGKLSGPHDQWQEKNLSH